MRRGWSEASVAKGSGSERQDPGQTLSMALAVITRKGQREREVSEGREEREHGKRRRQGRGLAHLPGTLAAGRHARWSCWSCGAAMKTEGDENEWRHAREELGRAPWVLCMLEQRAPLARTRA